jgi:hypothetical protein
MLAALALKAVLLHAGGEIRQLRNAAIQHDKNDAVEQCFSRMVDIHRAVYGERHFFGRCLLKSGRCVCEILTEQIELNVSWPVYARRNLAEQLPCPEAT